MSRCFGDKGDVEDITEGKSLIYLSAENVVRRAMHRSYADDAVH